MKILIVNISDIHGGAARAAYRLHEALLSQQVESRMLVIDKESNDPSVDKIEGLKEKILKEITPRADQLQVKKYKQRTQGVFSPSSISLSVVVDEINRIKPDIVHLHWICRSMIKIEDLKRIEAPIVWSLHDMWAFTGGCHYDEECGAYMESCGSCKVLGSNSKKDLSRSVFLRKKESYAHIKNMTIVGLSRWMHVCAKRSTLLKEKRHVQLPNPIDTTYFKPFDIYRSKERWGFSKEKKIVLFSAMSATSDKRKGFRELEEALKKIEDKEIEFAILGSNEVKKVEKYGFTMHYLGYITEDNDLISLYSAVDLLVIPSLQENLSNAIMESLACATPVVGFNIGGNADMIEHQKNGYLVDPFDTTDLARGIEWAVNCESYEALCKYAREKVCYEFESNIVVQKYIALYKEILHAN
jgi:glycosyltransferase involved in cell wall biosynthesis